MLCFPIPKSCMVARENRLRASQDFPLVKTTPDWWGVEGRLEKAWDVPCSCPSPHTSSLEDGVNNGDVPSARESLSRSPRASFSASYPHRTMTGPGPRNTVKTSPYFSCSCGKGSRSQSQLKRRVSTLTPGLHFQCGLNPTGCSPIWVEQRLELHSPQFSHTALTPSVFLSQLL